MSEQEEILEISLEDLPPRREVLEIKVEDLPRKTPASVSQPLQPRVQPGSRSAVQNSTQAPVTNVPAPPMERGQEPALEIPAPLITTPQEASIDLSAFTASTRRADPLVIERIASLPIVNIERPPAPDKLEISAHQIKPRTQDLLVITDEDVVRPTTIVEPVDGGEVGRRARVAGLAQPHSQLRLIANGYQAEGWSNEMGYYHFDGVPIDFEEGELRVESISYPRYARCRASVWVQRTTQPLLYLGRRDAYTQQEFTADDLVVRCQKNGHFSRMDSWRAVPGCAYPSCAANDYWTADDPQFYEE